MAYRACTPTRPAVARHVPAVDGGCTSALHDWVAGEITRRARERGGRGEDAKGRRFDARSDVHQLSRWKGFAALRLAIGEL